MNWFEKWMLLRTLRKIVRQGGQEEKITALYFIIQKLALTEYNEDNAYSVKEFLTDCFVDSQVKKYECKK